MKIWIHQDVESGEYFMYDNKLWSSSSGPFDVSNELHERIRESEREYQIIQDILESLVYDWKSSDERLTDCD